MLTGAVKGQPGYSVCKASAAAAHATARKPLSHRILSSLRAHAHGSFSVRGKYSAATVRGTIWDAIDRCDVTLSVVHSGTVLVTDSVTHKTIAVGAGHSYLAKAP